MEVKNSMDWAITKANLLVSLNKATDDNFANRQQATKLLRRIEGKVRHLSYAELNSRRHNIGANLRNVQEATMEVNKEIHDLENWLLLLMLSK
jgi:ABC-type transporter Mla subunit MlaD